MTSEMFRELLDHPDVEEVVVLRGQDRPREVRLGFMAYHGGGLEEMTEAIAFCIPIPGIERHQRSGKPAIDKMNFRGLNQPLAGISVPSRQAVNQEQPFECQEIAFYRRAIQPRRMVHGTKAKRSTSSAHD